MKFCDKCQSILEAKTTGNQLKFYCDSCKKPYDSKPEDSLRSQIVLKAENVESTGDMYYMELNAPHDPAGYRIDADCPNCGMKFLVKIYVGPEYSVRYICSCGYSASRLP